MTVSAIILALLVGVGALTYLHYRLTGGNDTSVTAEDAAASAQGSTTTDQESAVTDEECCGMHITCERDSLLAGVSAGIEYYDDEELDRYAGREDSAYTDSEIDEFREVLLTLLPTDIAGWARSLQLRGINLPVAVRDELFLIVTEARNHR